MHYLYWLTYAASIFVIISISWFGFLINQLSFFYTSSLSLFLLSTLSFYFLNWKQVNFIIIINRFAPGCCTRKLWDNLFEKHNFFVFQRVSRSPFLYPTTESFTCIYIYQNTSAKHLKTRIVWLRLQNHELICCLINAVFNWCGNMSGLWAFVYTGWQRKTAPDSWNHVPPSACASFDKPNTSDLQSIT